MSEKLATANTSEIEQLRTEALSLRSLPTLEQRRLIRTQAGISQARLARACGVSRECIRGWELGRFEPRGENRLRYLSALGTLAGLPE